MATKQRKKQMPTEKLLDQYLNTNEAAEYIDMQYATLLWHIGHGNIKTIQPTGPGGKYFIFKAELDRFKATRKVNKPEPAPELFIADNSRNVEIRNQAADLMLEGNRLLEKAYNLLKEIA